MSQLAGASLSPTGTLTQTGNKELMVLTKQPVMLSGAECIETAGELNLPQICEIRQKGTEKKWVPQENTGADHLCAMEKVAGVFFNLP